MKTKPNLLQAAQREAQFYRDTLEQISQDPRRTRGRRTAAAALLFLDAIRAEAAKRRSHNKPSGATMRKRKNPPRARTS